MAINFPLNPTTGDIYTEGSYSYEFTGVKWKPVGRTDYNIGSSDLTIVSGDTDDSLVIDFDLNGIQLLSQSNTGPSEVTFANLPDEDEYKKALIEIGFTTDYQDTEVTGYTQANNIVYENASYTVTDATDLNDIEFSDDGTKMFIGDSANSTIMEYALSPAWDITSATYQTAHAMPALTETLQITRTGLQITNMNGNGTFTFTAPPETEPGDFLILAAISNFSTNVSISNLTGGWTFDYATTANDAYLTRVNIYYKIHNAGDSLTYSVSLNNHYSGRYHIASYKGVDTSDPITGRTAYSQINASSPLVFNNLSPFAGGKTLLIGGASSANSLDFSLTTGDMDSIDFLVIGSNDPSSSMTSIFAETSTGGYFRFDAGGSSTNDSRATVHMGLRPRSFSASQTTDFKFADNGKSLLCGYTDTVDSGAIIKYDLLQEWDLSSLTESAKKVIPYPLSSFDTSSDLSTVYWNTGTSVIEFYVKDNTDLSSIWTNNSAYDMGRMVFVSDYTTSPNKMFEINANATNNILSYDMPFDFSSIALESTGTLSEGAGVVSGVFGKGGYRFYTLNNTTNTVKQYAAFDTATPDSIPTFQWPDTIEWEGGYAPSLPDLGEDMLIELEARRDYLGTSYTGKLVGRNI